MSRTHDQVVAEIQARAQAVSVLSHYCGRSERCAGDRGMPDLFLVGLQGSAWLEIKTPATPRLSPDQVQWAYQLRAAGQAHYIVQDAALENGQVDMILALLAGPDLDRKPIR